MAIVKSRLIYTAGTFSVTDELAVCRRVLLTISVLRRPPTQEYQNERSNPPKGFLGYVGLFINSYCERILPLEFDPQILILWENPAIQLYYTTLCSSANVVDALVALGAAMTPPAVLIPLTPEPSPFQGCLYTSLKFKLLFGTRIEVTAIGEEVVACAGITPQATVPDLDAPPSKYPSDRARSDDPARSDPEPGELPGDTAPATVEDPDASLSAGSPCVSVVRGRGVNLATCGGLDNLADRSYSGYVELVPGTVGGCACLRFLLDGVDQGDDEALFTDSFVFSRTGDCTPP